MNKTARTQQSLLPLFRPEVRGTASTALLSLMWTLSQAQRACAGTSKLGCSLRGSCPGKSTMIVSCTFGSILLFPWRDDEDSFAASIAEANMPASGSVAGDGGVPSVGTSDVREDPEDPEHGVILTLCRDRLDNGHHRANRRALPENFAVEIKFRRVPSGGHHGLGSYQPKLFDPLRGKAGAVLVRRRKNPSRKTF